MKTSLIFLSSMLLFLAACKNAEMTAEAGRMSFSIKEKAPIEKRLLKLENITKIFLTIETSEGEPVYQLKEMTLLKFGEAFVTEELSLPGGDYRITAFFAASDNNEILYATPVIDSELAPLVSHPLPIDFTVNSNMTESVEIEVVDITDHQPIELGYVTFTLTETSKALIKITANTDGITDINRVRVWILNKENHERQWTNLHLSSQDLNKWEGSIVLPKGDYEIELFAEVPTQTKDLAIAHSKKTARRIDGNTTLAFDHIKNQTSHWIRDSKHFTAIVGTDPCDLTFSIYPNNEVSTIDYYYFDRIFWNADGDVITYTYDEFFCDSTLDCGNGSVYTSTLLPITDCEIAKQQSNFIDAMMIVTGTLKSGEPAEEAYFFYNFTSAAAISQQMNSQESSFDRKLRLHKLSNRSVKN